MSGQREEVRDSATAAHSRIFYAAAHVVADPSADNGDFDNGFKAQWELFLRHVYADAPYHWNLLAGARGVQLAELGLKSSAEGRRLDVPEIAL